MRSFGFFILLLLAGEAKADSNCFPLEEAKSKANIMATASGGTWVILSQLDTDKFLSVFNADPPVSNTQAKNILVIILPSEGYGIFAGEEECGYRMLWKVPMRLMEKAWRAVKEDKL